MGLTTQQIRFAYGVAAGKTLTQAYIDAGYAEHSARANASRLMANADIAACVADRVEQLAAKEGIDENWVLRQWLQLAQADPNEIVQLRRVPCPYCWKDQEERVKVYTKLGFDPSKDPCIECGFCNGEGVERFFAADSRKLTGASKRLFAGVKMTQHGIEIKMRDQDAALQNIADYLGMRKKVEVSGPGGGPVSVAVKLAVELSDDELAAIAAAPASPVPADEEDA